MTQLANLTVGANLMVRTTWHNAQQQQNGLGFNVGVVLAVVEEYVKSTEE